MSMTPEALITAAREAAKKAYAPYSNFYVGAAILLIDGRVVTGANMRASRSSFGSSFLLMRTTDSTMATITTIASAQSPPRM